jgi:dUTP pyrophosphatase
MIKLKIKKISEEAVTPEYAHSGDAGVDLYSIEEKCILPGETALIHTGIQIELPENTEAQIRPRSGLALKHSITVLNSPGTIDEGYRGEICIILINHGKQSFNVEKKMRIAQMVISEFVHAEISEVEELSCSQRAERGFGSSGLKNK